ncbi:putative peroxisomal membrane protein [Phaeomoniella chlamydospora]|uniref:Putative peroxisomal membrane protein n=1 Tax=Phaeomoniella chlamydospora TaxID=158046 RepID=A0A0G2EEC7_PHACM|nr:putative peroxisomal membrane protein [Phaeomoniella chlamydospora]
MDRSLATLLRSLQTSSTHEEALRLIPAATGLLTSLNNPLNLELLSSQLLSAPALWDVPHTLAFSRQIFGSFYTAATNVAQSREPQVLHYGQAPLRKLKLEAWIKAVVKGANDKVPRWRHGLLLGGLLLGLARDQEGHVPSGLRHKLESALVTAINLALEVTAPDDMLGTLSIILVLNHTFDQLRDFERSRLNYDALLPFFTEAIFTSKEGLEHGTFLSILDQDVREIPGSKFRWAPQSPSCRHVRAILSKPLTTALGPLSRLAAHAIEHVHNHDLVLDTVGRIADFARTLAIQWRQNKLSEIDPSEEALYLDPETVQSSLPVLWQTLRSSLYASIIILRSALGRVVNDPKLGAENKEVQVSIQTLHALRNLYFISSKLGQTSTAQYNFVVYTAIDILNTYPRHAEAFLQVIRPAALGSIPKHPLDRCLDLFFLNTVEHFTLTLSPQVCEDLLLAAASPYLATGGNNALLEIFEAAHSVILAIFAAPQNTGLTTSQLPFYIETLFAVFPANLSERQFRFAFKTLVSVISPPSVLAREQPMFASTLLQLVYDRAWDASNLPLQSVSTGDDQSPGTVLSEQSALVMALLDSLPNVSPDVLEEWLPLTALLINRVKEAETRRICQERFWEVLSNGEMDVERATVASSYKMSTVRRGKNFNPEPHTRFLYAIVKQLDLRSIEWQNVANEIGIQNGHAARMRYARLKTQFEGPHYKKDSKAKERPARLNTKPKHPKEGLELHMRDPEDDSSEDEADGMPLIKQERKTMMGGFDFNTPMNNRNRNSSVENGERGIVKAEGESSRGIMPLIKQEPSSSLYPNISTNPIAPNNGHPSPHSYVKSDPSNNTSGFPSSLYQIPAYQNHQRASMNPIFQPLNHQQGFSPAPFPPYQTPRPLPHHPSLFPVPYQTVKPADMHLQNQIQDTRWTLFQEPRQSDLLPQYQHQPQHQPTPDHIQTETTTPKIKKESTDQQQSPPHIKPEFDTFEHIDIDLSSDLDLVFDVDANGELAIETGGSAPTRDDSGSGSATATDVNTNPTTITI